MYFQVKQVQIVKGWLDWLAFCNGKDEQKTLRHSEISKAKYAFEPMSNESINS